MGLYNKPVLDLLYDLINRDNPGLMTPLSSKNTLLLGGPFTNNLGTSGRNTRATFNAIAGKGYTGDLEVFYDRINLSYLFNNQIPKVTVPYLATTRAQMLPYINATLGLELTESDISIPASTVSASTVAAGNVVINVPANCLTFIGSFTVNYIRELPRLIDVYLPKNDYAVKMWSNYAFTGKIHNRNFHPFQSILSGIPTNVSITANTTGAAAFLNMLITTTGLPFTLNTNLSSDPGEFEITGAVMTYVMTRNLPDANVRFQYAYVLTPIPGKHKWTKPIYFHTNPRLTETSTMGYEDLLRYVAGKKFTGIRGDQGVSSQQNSTITIEMINLAETQQLIGSPWAGYFKLNGTAAARLAQHCFPDEASYNYAVANKLKVVVEFGPVSTMPFLSKARNGYTSVAGTAATDTACVVNRFIYVDASTQAVKVCTPSNAGASTAWLPTM